MAFSMTVNRAVPLVGNIDIATYVRVESILMSKSSAAAVAIWRHNDGSGISFDRTEFEFAPDLNSADNIIRQAYLHLKTLPEFAGATDC
jgi:hypothetical protein